ncbi:MAG TPA: DNA repair protein RadA [Edaphocola sp.]|nr:DNA repair protein RadA [Edaphocola sp.]
MKPKSAFFCQSCGYESPKWAGKCPSCGEWNTFVEEPVVKLSKSNNTNNVNWTSAEAPQPKTQSIEAIAPGDEYRILLPDEELNRSLGGGLVPGSVVLIGGEPGIGKSTLFLQCALQWTGAKILYISGEESARQIKMRAERIGLHNPDLLLLTATDTQTIFQEIKKEKPQWVIVDSIQTMSSPYIESAPGSVGQVRECAAEFQRFAKESHTPVCIIGHITKDGSIAGPKILEHMVDAVLQFEGDRHYAYRILRTLKNRFGSTAELAIYEMAGNGMQPVSNPSEILLSQQDGDLSGIAIGVSVEGTRPIMMEIQALVAEAVYGTPQRTVNGFDLRKLQLLLAVLEKRGGFHFGMKDVFLNLAGGLRMDDPSIDLPVVCALLSSFEDKPLPLKTCFVGEVGLSGEIRAVNRIEQRIAEAERMGIETIFIPKANLKGSATFSQSQIQVQAVQKVSEVYQLLF